MDTQKSKTILSKKCEKQKLYVYIENRIFQAGHKPGLLRGV